MAFPGRSGLTAAWPWGLARPDMMTTTLAPVSVDIGAVQTTRKLCLLVTVVTIGALFALGAPCWSPAVQATIKWVGFGLILICICGRTWCSLYIGGRKTSALVTIGPYSISRNPLYLFSIIGAVGAGAQVGGVSIAILAGIFVWIVHLTAVIQEERLLLAEHADAFRRYVADVPRFLPRLSGWQDVAVLEVRPRSVTTTFVDACFFLAAVPLAALFAYVQAAGYIRVFLTLP
jgi:protein-S-isoprenylcysteine O-methyltransferase Ste14